MSNAEIPVKLDRFRRAANPTGHLTVTELARGKDWRKKLLDVGMLEITDRGETLGWLVSQDDINALVKTLSDLESQVERLKATNETERSRNKASSKKKDNGDRSSADAVTSAVTQGSSATKRKRRSSDAESSNSVQSAGETDSLFAIDGGYFTVVLDD